MSYDQRALADCKSAIQQIENLRYPTSGLDLLAERIDSREQEVESSAMQPTETL